MPSTSSTTPVLSSSGVSQPDNVGVTAKESDTDRVLLSMKFCFSAPPLTLFTLQWAYTMLLSPPPPPRKILDPTLISYSLSCQYSVYSIVIHCNTLCWESDSRWW